MKLFRHPARLACAQLVLNRILWGTVLFDLAAQVCNCALIAHRGYTESCICTICYNRLNVYVHIHVHDPTVS